MGKKFQKQSKPTKSAAIREIEEAEEVEFPDEASEPDSRLEDKLTLLYGPPKIGKTTFASKLEDPLFLATEPGHKFIRARVTNIANWPTFTKAVERLEKEYGKTVECSTFVVDTVDNLAKFCRHHVCAVQGIAHPSDQEWGKGWDALFDQFNEWIVRLCMIGPGVVFIGHSTEKEVTSRGLKITKTMPAMATTAYRAINPLVDFIFYAGFKREKVDGKVKISRVLYTKPSEERDAGDRSSVLPATMKLDAEEVKKILRERSA